jgi:oxygen-independent coproporphyrinogen-3 oxidase
LNVVQILDGLSQAQTRGFIERHHQRIVPNQLGQRFLNDLVQLFLAEE